MKARREECCGAVSASDCTVTSAPCDAEKEPRTNPYAYSRPHHRIAEGMSGLLSGGRFLPRPFQLGMHLTNRCNLRCPFCPTKNLLLDRGLVTAERELSTGQWLRLLDQAADLGVQEAHICGGGEPLFAYGKAMAVMRHIKELGKYGELVTNGTRFRPETASDLARMGWDKITFSIDGPTGEVHDRMRGNGCFRRVVDAIAQTTRLKRELQVGKPRLAVATVVCTLNYRSIPEMITLCKDLGIGAFSIQALNVWTDSIREYQLTDRQRTWLRPVLEAAHERAEAQGIVTNIPGFLRHGLLGKANAMDKARRGVPRPMHSPHILNAACYMPWYNVSVLPDGTIQPCFVLRGKGRSFREHSLKGAWESGCFESLRRRMLGNRPTKDCAMCNPWDFTRTEEIRQQLLQ